MPLPIATGALWLCGKHAIGPDPDAVVRRTGADVVVCLTERHELDQRYPEYVTWLQARPAERAVWSPIPDLHVPDPPAAWSLVRTVTGHLEADRSVLMHCAAGIGRAGTLACLVLVTLGLSVEEAEATVASARPMAGPEAGAQRALLHAWPELVARRAGEAVSDGGAPTRPT